MKAIYSQPYLIVNREIINNEQIYLQSEKYIFLFVDQIITSKDKFNIEEVLDLSYKLLSTNYCLLYLHTNQGIFTYKVESPPDKFIEEFVKLKRTY
ncbi:hypothetical protein GH741_04035 [Aquibacillus halophilus]|uniref:YokE-like PH domain-containing protein n=1 Tax=Aquibacillus halophilus TaxID=930132 RepID=A0A6A8DDJ4_9BACI|nr:hypothetical protein [Aquibacillus halophilus]MRH41841.1 hypothetical protein [Aquibacillus halophilus]